MSEMDLRQVRRLTLRVGASELVVYVRCVSGGEVTLWVDAPFRAGDWRAALALDGSVSAERARGSVRGFRVTDAEWADLLAEGDLWVDEATGHAHLTDEARARLAGAAVVIRADADGPLDAWADALGALLREDLDAGDDLDAFVWSLGPEATECLPLGEMAADAESGRRTRLLPALERLRQSHRTGGKLIALVLSAGRTIDDLMEAVRCARDWQAGLAAGERVILAFVCFDGGLAEPERQALASLDQPDGPLRCVIARVACGSAEIAPAVLAELLQPEDVVLGALTVTCEGARVTHAASGRAIGVPRRIAFTLPNGADEFELRVEQAEDEQVVERCYPVTLKELTCRAASC